MDATGWLSCADPGLMLDGMEGRIGKRKLRLFACACCRRIWHLIPVEICRHAVEAAEAFADDRVSSAELKAAFQAAEDAMPLFADGNLAAVWAAAGSAAQAAQESSMQAARAYAMVAAQPAAALGWAAVRTGATEPAKQDAWSHYEAASAAAFIDERSRQADLLREIAGSPLAPAHAPTSYPLTVWQLAEAVYAGEECTFALHDALLEAGASELAEHFRSPEQGHPRGCWAVDRILGKS